MGRLRCEKRFIVDDERIRLGLRDRRDVLLVTDVAHLSLRAAAGDARLMATLWDNQGFPLCFEHATGDLDPVRELPYRPAAVFLPQS